MPLNLPLVQISFEDGFLGSVWTGANGDDGSGVESASTANASASATMAIGSVAHPFVVKASPFNLLHVTVSHSSGPGLGHTGFVVSNTDINVFDPASALLGEITTETAELQWLFTNYYTEPQTISVAFGPFVEVGAYDVFIFSISPASGSTEGGTSVTLTGQNFLTGAVVTFDGLPATDVVVVDYNTITCVTPAHASGAVEVVVTNTDAVFGSLADGFRYIASATAPTVDMGNFTFVNGPAPSTVSTDVTVTPGDLNGNITYGWAQTSGPDTVLDPTIVSPSEVNTDIIFNEYAPGTYEFTLTVTTEDFGSGSLVIQSVATFIIEVTRAPRVSHGSVQDQWNDPAELIPIITDDGWGGELTETITLVSGCGTPTMTHRGFFDPAVFDNIIFDVRRWEITDFPEITCVYIFRITVTRADGLVGSGIWRVLVYLVSDEEPAPTNDGPVILFVNGEEVVPDSEEDPLVESTNVNKSLTANPTCNFRLYNHKLSIFNDVVIERGSVRLFGGICIAQTLMFDENNPFYTVSLVGYSWHLGRTRITKSYVDVSFTDIVLDLAGFALGGLTAGTYVQTGLPTATIDFVDQTIDQCLTAIVNALPGSHWKVDDYNRLHFAILEESGDPFPVIAQALRKYNIRNLQLTEDGGPVVNRVHVKHTTVTRTPIETNADVEVDTLDGYAPSGVADLNGATIFYTGLARKAKFPIFGNIPTATFWSQDDLGPTGPYGFNATAYGLTAVTRLGETPIFTSRSANVTLGAGFRITNFGILDGAQDEVASQILYFNIYVLSSSEGSLATFPYLVGQLATTTGSYFDDTRPPSYFEGVLNDGGTLKRPPTENTAEDERFYLTGCTGYTRTTVLGTETVDDPDAQIEIALAMGLTLAADGVIETTIDGGDIDAGQARLLGEAYLEESKNVRHAARWTTRDDKSTPGQVESFVLPSYDFEDDLKIQTVDLNGFESGVPHEYQITAARDAVTVEDLLRKSPAVTTD